MTSLDRPDSALPDFYEFGFYEVKIFTLNIHCIFFHSARLP